MAGAVVAQVTYCTIRLTCRPSPVDHSDEVVLIGPYASDEARNEEIRRLASLPASNGHATFEPSSDDHRAADLCGDAHRIAEARSLRGVLNLLYDPRETSCGWFTDASGEAM